MRLSPTCRTTPRPEVRDDGHVFVSLLEGFLINPQESGVLDFAPRQAAPNRSPQDAVLGALAARDRRLEDRLELAGVQMPPAASLLVVTGAVSAALRANQRRRRPPRQANDHLSLVKPKLNRLHPPRLGDAKDLCVKLPVLHGSLLVGKTPS